ncbi:hypothetical protein [Acinetobacter entericus]|uniref:Uncharacterized protein n=1 Tax=Acinetobacter entericus TaxID=2989714 RepID=A0ABT3NNK2_9GAMM|nr:hypothetical protein [Acinetobacter entericus]MCW8041125.1 hypothetical protein [Acinetobacter entericus]
MNFIILFISTSLLFVSFGAFSQDEVYGWRTDTITQRTSISAGIPDDTPPFLYKIINTKMIDSNRLEFNFQADKNILFSTLEEGSAAFIAAKNLDIVQKWDGEHYGSGWLILPQNRLTKLYTSSWQADLYSPDGAKTILASLGEKNYVIISFGQLNNRCQSGKLKIFIDYKPLKDTKGNEINLLPGGSILTFGKDINIEVSGVCPNNPDTGTFQGNFTILKDTLKP